MPVEPTRRATPGITVRGTGYALPERVVTNDELARTLDTSHDWIVERTGIHRRHLGSMTSELAVEAGRAALRAAGWDGTDVDLLILATTTPDLQVPATSGVVAEQLGVRGGALDVNAACAGFTYALVLAAGQAALGSRRILVIGCDTLRRITDWGDRSSAILFGDAAGAFAVEAVDGPGDLLAWDLGVDGSQRDILRAELGGVMKMDGREVFRRAVRAMVSSAHATLERAGLGTADVDVIVPHQANLRIIEAACSRLGVPVGRAVVTLDETANTSSASIPMAASMAVADGRIGSGDLVLLVGFGAGMTWASALLRWP